jgi:hypothetical protein
MTRSSHCSAGPKVTGQQRREGGRRTDVDRPFRGTFSIAQTPFSDAGDILWDDLEYECDWILRTGTHGFVYLVMVSEFTVLSYI